MQDSKDNSNKSLAPRIAIGAIFKNECPYILEWLAHYRSMGIFDFYIADNISDDGTSELLIQLHDAGIITRIEFPTVRGVAPQMPAYNLIFERSSAKIDWLLYVDADEFLIPTDGNKNLNHWFSTVARWDDVGAVAINWCVYGSAGRLTHSPGLVTQRFDQHAFNEFGVNGHYKTMLRCAAVGKFSGNPHYFSLDKGWRYADAMGNDLAHSGDSKGLSAKVLWEPVRINHYVVKSKEEFFLKKRARGRASNLDVNEGRTESFFVGHDRNEVRESLDPAIAAAIQSELVAIQTRLHANGVAAAASRGGANAELICDPSLPPWARVLRASVDGNSISFECSGFRQDLETLRACFLILNYGRVIELTVTASDESSAREVSFTLSGQIGGDLSELGDTLSAAIYTSNGSGPFRNVSIPETIEIAPMNAEVPGISIGDSVHRGLASTPLAGGRIYKVVRLLKSDFQPWRWHLDHPQTSSSLASFGDSVAIIAGWAAHASGPGYQLAVRIDGALKLLPFTQRRNDTITKLSLDDGGDSGAMYGFNQKLVVGDVVEIGFEYLNTISWALRFEKIKHGSSNH